MNPNFIEEMIENYAFHSKKTNEYQFIEFIHENRLWHLFLSNYECEQPITDRFKEQFHLFWIERGEFIRNQIKDDQLLVDMLRKTLPAYTGKELQLYRGENLQRFKDQRIGLCWTEDLETAQMFSTRNACKDGGIILSATFNEQSIIAGIHSHSIYLEENEYTVDSFKLNNLQILKMD